MISLTLALIALAFAGGFVTGRFVAPRVSAEVKQEFAAVVSSVEKEAVAVKQHAQNLFVAHAPRQSPVRQVPTR